MIHVKEKPEVRICKVCGKEFYPANKNSTICMEPHFFTCKVCGKQFEANRKYLIRGKIPRTCSPECRGILSGVSRTRPVETEADIDKAMENWQIQKATGGFRKRPDIDRRELFPVEKEGLRAEKLHQAQNLLRAFEVRKTMENAYAVADICLRHRLLEPLPPDAWMGIPAKSGGCSTSRRKWLHMSCGQVSTTRTAFCPKCGHPMVMPTAQK